MEEGAHEGKANQGPQKSQLGPGWVSSVGLGNSRLSLGWTLMQGVPEPRKPREGAIRKPSQKR